LCIVSSFKSNELRHGRFFFLLRLIAVERNAYFLADAFLLHSYSKKNIGNAHRAFGMGDNYKLRILFEFLHNQGKPQKRPAKDTGFGIFLQWKSLILLDLRQKRWYNQVLINMFYRSKEEEIPCSTVVSFCINPKISHLFSVQ